MAMRIYTRGGDKGQTGLFGGTRVPKSDLRVSAYGEVDELNACIGLARTANLPAEVASLLGAVQDELFTLGAELANCPRRSASAHHERCDVFFPRLPQIMSGDEQTSAEPTGDS